MGTERFAILLGGEVTPTGRLRRQLAGCRTIAADSGIRHADPLNLVPELWVGDFDSAETGHHERHPDVPRATFSPDKDMSDGEIAIEAALRRGAGFLWLVGAFGGRTDHATAHMLGALALAGRGVGAVLTSGAEEAVPLGPEGCRPSWPAGTGFSVLAFTELRGLTLKGAKWPLDAVDVAMGSTRTLSNVAADGLAASVASGRALLTGRLV